MKVNTESVFKTEIVQPSDGKSMIYCKKKRKVTILAKWRKFSNPSHLFAPSSNNIFSLKSKFESYLVFFSSTFLTFVFQGDGRGAF